MKLFMDNVPTLAIRAPIVKKIPDMLSPKAVANLMDEDLIAKIAGESEDKASQRQETLRTLEKLEKGARICRDYALRPSSSKLHQKFSSQPPILICLVSRPAEGSSNIGAQQSSVRNRPEQGKSRQVPGRRSSTSISEDGRGTSGNEERISDQAPSIKSGMTLNVTDSANIQRPTSTGLPFGAQSAASKPIASSLFASYQAPIKSSAGGGLFGNLSANSTPFGAPSSNISTSQGLFPARPMDLSTSTSSNETGRTGSGLFGSSTTTSAAGTVGGTGLFSGITSAANGPATATSSSTFGDSGSKPRFAFGTSPSKPTASTGTSLFGGSGFGSASSSIPSNKGAE